MSKIAILAYRAKEHKKALDLLTKRAEEIQAEMDEINATVEADAEGEELTAEEIDNLESKADALDKELEEKNAEIGELNEKIAELESKIEEANKKNEEDKRSQQKPEAKKERGEEKIMGKATRGFFNGIDKLEVRSIMERQEVKEFAQRVREMVLQERSVTGAELGIPEVFMGIVRDNMHKYSKLLKYVNLKKVRGTARQIIAGTIPEAVWAEMCANLNELSINFNEVQVDGYKVGGYVAVCNATIDDTDIDLVDEIMTSFSQAIGFSVDKAILYGKGVKMPVGIVTRLAEAAKPAYWGVNEPAWVDLRTTNILTLNDGAEVPKAANGIDLFKAIFGAVSKAKANFSTGEKFFAMNESTYRTLQMEGLSINVNGAIVSAVDGSMPFVGGKVEFFDFIPDGDVIGGYGSNYLVAEREGAIFEQSRHAQFTAQKTVFLASARYDGRPVVSDSFVLFNINNVTPTKTMTFAADTANA